MEVKGAKNSKESGAIPADWRFLKLSEIGKVIRGASPRPQGDKRYYGGEIPRLMVEDVTRDGKYVTPKIDFLTEEGARRSRPCPQGTLTMVCSGVVGVPSILSVDACIHDGFLAILIFKKKFSTEYLYYQVDRMRSSFDSSATHGGVFTNLTTSGVKEFKIPLPPTLAEQEAIADALSDADTLIESLEQLIAKKRQINQGAMQELLTGKRRLPGFSGEWEQKKFGEIAHPRQERTNPLRDEPRNFCVELEHVGQGTGKLVGFTGTSEFSSIKSVFRKNDVLFGKLRAYLRKYWKADRNGVCSTEIWVLAANESLVLPDYLYQLVKTNTFIEGASEAYGTHMPRSDWKVVREIEFKLPLLSEQKAIAATLSNMDSEISELETKLAKARRMKQGMMQELLTGRIRLI